MAFLFTKKNRTHDVQTRIVKHESEKHSEPPARPVTAPAFVTDTVREWRKEGESFGGFNSPPGRF